MILFLSIQHTFIFVFSLVSVCAVREFPEQWGVQENATRMLLTFVSFSFPLVFQNDKEGVQDTYFCTERRENRGNEIKYMEFIYRGRYPSR